MQNQVNKILLIGLLFPSSIFLTSCAPKTCESARSNFENEQTKYAKLGEELTQQITNKYGDRLRGSQINSAADEVYAKSKSAADRLAVAQNEYQEACKSTKSSSDSTDNIDRDSKVTEKKEPTPTNVTANVPQTTIDKPEPENTTTFSTLPAEELAAQNERIERSRQETVKCVEKMKSGQIEAYNECIKNK
jgi:hypothetical protein